MGKFWHKLPQVKTYLVSLTLSGREIFAMRKIKSQNELDDIVHLIGETLRQAFRKVNKELVLLYIKETE